MENIETSGKTTENDGGKSRRGLGKKIFKIGFVSLSVFLAFVILLGGSVLIWTAFKSDAEAGGYMWSPDMPFSSDYGYDFDMRGKEVKILILTDLHYTRVFGDGKTDKLIAETVRRADPDLIVLLGDNAFTPFNTAAYKRLIEVMDGYKIPWAPVFGNHDEQGKATKNYLAKTLAESEYCLFDYGPKDTGGAGNYFINLTDGGQIAHTLYFLDSFPRTNGNYLPPTEKQVKFYEWAVNGITASAGQVRPSTLMYHIPLPEYAAAYDKAVLANSVLYGARRESECASNVNSGLFDKIKELGSTKQIFCGHDHVNDYSVMYEGIRLTYALSSGFGSYGDPSVKGGTLYTVKRNGEREQERIFYIP